MTASEPLIKSPAGAATASVVWGYRAYQTEQFISNNVRCDGGCSQAQFDAIRDAGRSPVGQRLMASYKKNSAILHIYAESASSYTNGLRLGPHVVYGSNDMYFDGNTQQTLLSLPDGGMTTYGSFVAGEPWGPSTDDGTTFIHELGHTRTAGGLLDSWHQDASPLTDVVGQAENKYRAWMGLPSRDDYSIPSRGQDPAPVHQPPFRDQRLTPWR